MMENIKNGDILTDGSIIYISKGGDKAFEAYIGKNYSQTGNGFFTDTYCCKNSKDKLQYANKKEKELLFEDMKRYGYEWNLEEKVLKKPKF